MPNYKIYFYEHTILDDTLKEVIISAENDEQAEIILDREYPLAKLLAIAEEDDTQSLITKLNTEILRLESYQSKISSLMPLGTNFTKGSDKKIENLKAIVEELKAELSSEESELGEFIDESDPLFAKIPEKARNKILTELKNVVNYVPKIGIMGKSGAGKSSLANAIVGKQVFETGSLGGCTREMQEEVIRLGRRKMAFIDLPGISESPERHQEYLKMYEEKLPELDIILWAIKIDDRALSDDIEFFNWLIQRYNKEQIIFVLTQVDKTEPTREWNYAEMKPSEKQLSVINDKLALVAEDFGIDANNNIVAVCAEFYEGEYSRYNFDLLIQKIVHNVPKRAQGSLYASVAKENRSQKAKNDAISGFQSILDELSEKAIEALVPLQYQPVAKIAKKAIVSAGKALWDRFFG